MPSLIGHEVIVKDLKKLAEGDKLSHGYVFYGPAMVGKRTVALSLARFLEKHEFGPPAENEILQDAELINLAFAQQLDPNVKDSVGINAVREIKHFLWQKPNVSKKRTLIIDEAELLTTEAENALLKVAEEPPASSLLIVIASDIEGLAGTIRSRLQSIYFGTVAEAEIAAWLTKEHGVAKAESAAFAKRALGKPGLAYRLLRDTAFAEIVELARKFLKTAPASRRDFVKKLIEPDEFKLRNFLDAVIITLAWETPSKAKAALWHKAVALQQNATNFSLNPRLQLENLLI